MKRPDEKELLFAELRGLLQAYGDPPSQRAQLPAKARELLSQAIGVLQADTEALIETQRLLLERTTTVRDVLAYYGVRQDT